MDSRFTLYISPSKNRLSFNQASILVLGYPKRVRFLVNPEKKYFVVQPCNDKEVLSYKTPRDFGVTRHGFEVNSQKLTDLIYNTMEWDPSACLRIVGKYVESQNIVVFDLTAAEVVTVGEEG